MGAFLSASAQDINASKLLWSASANINQADGKQTAYPCIFATNGGQAITWSQQGGADITIYNVTSVEGSWPDVAKDGQYLFHVVSGSLAGTFSFSRASGNLQLHAQLNFNGKPNFDFVFLIDTVTPQP